MDKKFTLVINSLDYYQRFNANINDQSYLLNNTNIPAGKYKCRFSYHSVSEAITTFNTYPSIYLRTGAFVNTYAVGASGGNQISYCIGTAKQVLNPAGTASYYHSSPVDNCCFYLNYSPSYEIRVTLNTAGTTALFTGTGNYMILVEMERICECEE